MTEKIISKYFFFVLSLLPVTFMIGSSVSLVNILIIDFSFIFLIIYKSEWSWIKNFNIKILLLLYVYLIFNSFISLDSDLNFYRNFGFIRFIILFAALNYLFFTYKSLNKVFKIWTIIILIIAIDVFIERITGTNIFGYGAIEINGVPQPDGRRVMSFFKDEAVVGGFIFSFSLITFGFLLPYIDSYNKKKKFFLLSIILLIFLSIILSGERSSSVKAILSFTIFFLLYKNIRLKKKIIALSLVFILSLSIVMNNEYLKNRFYEQSIVSFNNINHFFDPDRVYLGTIQSGALDENLVQSLKPSTSLYFMLYKSGFEVFKNYPYFGVGNKNYRIESCLSKKEYAGIVNNVEKYICLTHPHQIYFEFLSEHGIIGTIILLSLIFILLFRILKNLYITKSYIGLGCFCYLITTFIPIIPSGAFFSEFSISLFFINLSIMYASNSKTNIFSSDK
jgi:hypothetical protein